MHWQDIPLLKLSPLLAAIPPLLAQAVDPSGVAGWSSFGIAGLVLAWLLLKHLPAKDVQLKELLLSRDALMENLLKREQESCEKRHQENLAETRLAREAQDKRHEAMLAQFQLVHDESKETRHRVADVAQTMMVWVALVKMALKIPLEDDISGQDHGTRK